MRTSTRLLPAAAACIAIAVPIAVLCQEQASARLTPEEQEQFLRTAKIVRTKSTSKGITGSMRVTMSDGKITHDAHVQTIDESKAEFKTDRGVELNFRDSYKYNIAAYRLGRLLGLDNIPVSIERKVGGKTAAVTWWVDDVLMDEESRHKKKMDAPDPEHWNQQMYRVRVFDQLIYNVDRNLGNLLILKNWDLEMIDHTRSFRLSKTLQNVKNLTKCDRDLLTRLKALDESTLVKQLRPWCTKTEIQAVLARRDAIVDYFETQAKTRGENSILYDYHHAQ